MYSFYKFNYRYMKYFFEGWLFQQNLRIILIHIYLFFFKKCNTFHLQTYFLWKKIKKNISTKYSNNRLHLQKKPTTTAITFTLTYLPISLLAHIFISLLLLLKMKIFKKKYYEKPQTRPKQTAEQPTNTKKTRRKNAKWAICLASNYVAVLVVFLK